MYSIPFPLRTSVQLPRPSFWENSSSQAGIYIITHSPTGQIYLGQTANFDRRWEEHRTRDPFTDTKVSKLGLSSPRQDLEFQILHHVPAPGERKLLEHWYLHQFKFFNPPKAGWYAQIPWDCQEGRVAFNLNYSIVHSWEAKTSSPNLRLNAFDEARNRNLPRHGFITLI